jgi:hypothetical protein
MDAENLLNELLNNEFNIGMMKEVLDELNMDSNITQDLINSVSDRLDNDLTRKLNGWTSEDIHKSPRIK